MSRLFAGLPGSVRARRAAFVVLAYALAAWLIHGAGLDLTRNLVGGGDAYYAGFPAKLFAATFSAWNPNVQLGQFAFANTQYQVFYPPAQLAMGLFANTLGYNIFLLGHFVLAGVFFYLFCRSLDLNVESSFGGGLLFLSSGFLTAHKGHQAMFTAAVWIPLVLYYVRRYAGSLLWRDAALAGAAIAMSLLAGFPQVTLYGILLAVFYWIWLSGRKAWLAIALMGGIAALLSSLQLLAVAEILPHVTRQQLTLEMFNQNFLPPVHLAGYLVPNLMGGMHGFQPYAYGSELVEVFPYCGILAILLAFCAPRGPQARFWVGVLCIAAVLALGLSPLQRFLFRVPVYNLFRAPARHLFEMNLALCVLAAMGWDRARRHTPLRALALTAAALAAAIWVALHAAPHVNFYYPTLAEAQKAQAANLQWSGPTLLFPLLALVASAAALLLRAPSWVLALVLVADVSSVSRTIYANPDTTDLYGPERRAETKFLYESGLDPAVQRVLPVDVALGHTYPLLSMMYGLNVINDYTPMWIKRYHAVTSFDLNGVGGENLLIYPKLLSSLSVRYVLARQPVYVDFVRRAGVYRELAVTRDGIMIYENPSWLPRFRFVSQVHSVPDLEQAKAWMLDEARYHPSLHALVEGWSGPTQMGPARMISYDIADTRLQWDLETGGSAFLVVADTWFPGWEAKVDGHRVPIHVTNGFLRGVYVQGAGNHRVEMEFHPWSVPWGFAGTLAGLLLIGLLWNRGREARS